jgi:hypothetical protein
VEHHRSFSTRLHLLGTSVNKGKKREDRGS